MKLLYKHQQDENLCQMIYQILARYFNDNDADELTNDPVMNAILDKDGLASQPTLSRFFNRMDEDTLKQFEDILMHLKSKVYAIKKPKMVLLELDSTLLDTYGSQEGVRLDDLTRNNKVDYAVVYDELYYFLAGFLLYLVTKAFQDRL